MEQRPEEGELHHFQLVNADGQVPISITLLVHVNRSTPTGLHQELSPLTANDVLAFHDAMRNFDGNFIKAFKKR